MELFGTCFYLWQVLLAVYIVGMFAIGYPMGKYSIIVWKRPYKKGARRLLLGIFLFPVNGIRFTVGTIEKINPYYPLLMKILKMDMGFALGDKNVLAEYRIIQMIVWPIRLTYILATLFSFIVVGIIGCLGYTLQWLFIKQPAKLLLKTEAAKN